MPEPVDPVTPASRLAWTLDELAAMVIAEMTAGAPPDARTVADGCAPAEHLLASAADGTARHMKAGVVVLPPGFHGTPHVHDAEELTVCVQGAALITIGDRVERVTAGTVLWTPAELVHWAEVPEDDEACVLLYAYAPPTAPITRLGRGA